MLLFLAHPTIMADPPPDPRRPNWTTRVTLDSVYVPRHFEMSEDDAAALAGMVGVGHLVTSTDAGLDSSFVPFLVDRVDGDRVDGNLVVRAHIAAANPQRHAFAAGAAALLIVQGPDAYVSPSLYPSKVEHGRVVPTWNYAIVHLHGHLQLVDDRDRLLDLVTRLTNLHEGRREAPWVVSDAPAEFIDGQLKAIVGIEMTVERIEGKAKLSQNRVEPDRAAVRAAFIDGDKRHRQVGAMMP
jgi:transcriptional regulator